jgi:hypothetical protein
MRPRLGGQGDVMSEMGLLSCIVKLLEIVKNPAWTCKSIPTHHGGHPDERVAVWMLRRHGEKAFRGVTNAPVTYYDTGRFTPDGRDVWDWVREGHLPVGIWYSPLDEHGLPESVRKSECATTLVAQALGLRQDERFARIIELTLSNDRKGGSKAWDFPAMLDEMYLIGMSEDSIQVVANCILDAKMAAQRRFMDAVNEMTDKPPRVVHVAGSGGKVYHLAITQSNNPAAHRALNLSRELTCGQCPPKDGRMQFFRPTVVIQAKPGGAMTVFGRKGVYLSTVARGWRIRQAVADGLRLKDIPEAELLMDGTHPKIRNIHYQSEACRIISGGLRTRDKKPDGSPVVPPTRVPLGEIEKLVVECLAHQ